LSGVFFQVYETQSTLDVPHPGEWFEAVQSTWKRTTKSVEVDQPVVISTALTVVDFASRFIPGVGDLIDIAEFAKGLQTGRDFVGRKLSQTDLVLMGVGALLPFAMSGAMRAGKSLRKVFGRKARKAGELLDDLRPNKEEARLIHEVEDLIKQGANIPL